MTAENFHWRANYFYGCRVLGEPVPEWLEWYWLLCWAAGEML